MRLVPVAVIADVLFMRHIRFRKQYGPGRKIINYSFLALAMSAGLTSAITNPLVPETPLTLMACDLLLARDEYGMNWIKAHRK